MNTANSNSLANKPRRRFFRFSLRRLLVTMAIAAVSWGFIAWLLREPDYPIIMISSPVVSPRGDKVAFATARSDKRLFDWASGDIVEHTKAYEHYAETFDVRLSIVSLADGKTTHTAANILNRSTPITWAPDQSHIVLDSGRSDPMAPSNSRGLDSFDLSTHAVTHFTSPEARTPKYSPQGTYVGYVCRNDLVVERSQTRERGWVQSGVDAYSWCWGASDTNVFYIRNGFFVCHYDLQSNVDKTLFAASPADEKYPQHIVSSPDGAQMGYHFDGCFYIVDLQSGKTTKQFPCDHYFLNFDWNAKGICFVDAVNGERRYLAKLMVFDLNTGKSTVIATGPFSYPSWLGDAKVLVRKGATELWAYSINDRKGEKIFGPPNEAEQNDSGQ